MQILANLRRERIETLREIGRLEKEKNKLRDKRKGLDILIAARAVEIRSQAKIGPLTQELVARWVGMGNTPTQIAAELNRRKIKTPAGKAWRGFNVSAIFNLDLIPAAT